MTFNKAIAPILSVIYDQGKSRATNKLYVNQLI